MGSTASDSTARFRQADELFRAEKYHEAYMILSDLNREYPNTKNILFPLALCYEQFGQPQKAEQLCDQLIGMFQDPRAIQMKTRLSASSMNLMFDPIEINPTPPACEAKRAAESESNTLLLVLGGIFVAIIVAVLFALPFYQASNLPVASNEHITQTITNAQPYVESARGPQHSIVFRIFLRMLVACIVSSILFYPILAVLGKLPSEDMIRNFLDILFIVGVWYVCSIIPFIGIIAGAILFIRRYDLGFVEFIVIGTIVVFVQYHMLLGSVPFLLRY